MNETTLPSPVHFIGISGIGMSALARLLLARGIAVSGSSDRSSSMTQRLMAEGARIVIGHDALNVGDARTVVVSTAIPADNAEYVAAKERGLEVVRRGEFLARMMDASRGIAIAGTHGKTTTTAMVARVLEAGGLDPSVIVGGERTDTLTNAHAGTGEWFVCEADESDGSFLALRPELAVVTNIENDHIGSDDELPSLVDAFRQFLASIPASGLALVGNDEPHAAALAAEPRDARTMTFGFGDADVAASDIRYENFGSISTISIAGKTIGTLQLAVPGAINILDALPAVALARELAVPTDAIFTALAGFRGVRRRFEVLARSDRMVVVDDYAHHPTAVMKTIAAARANWTGPLVVAFQPHRYSRTRYLAPDFAGALRAADLVVLTDIYAASELPIAGIDATSIGDPLLASGTPVAYVSAASDLPAYLLQNAPVGALVLMLGAGDITMAAHSLAESVLDTVAVSASELSRR